MVDRRNPPNTRLRAVREDEFQMSRMEFAQLVVDTGEEMGEQVGCTARLVAAWEPRCQLSWNVGRSAVLAPRNPE